MMSNKDKFDVDHSFRAVLTDYQNHNQGSNLTFELNSQMASTCSGFTSHKRVSTSLGTSVQHKMKKNVKNPVVIKR